MTRARLECGCEIELNICHDGRVKSGKMLIPCSIHFGREKVRAPGIDYEEDYQYRVGIEIDGTGAYKHFRTIDAAEDYWDEHKHRPDIVFQRKVKNTDQWKDLN